MEHMDILKHMEKYHRKAWKHGGVCFPPETHRTGPPTLRGAPAPPVPAPATPAAPRWRAAWRGWSAT